MHLQHQGLAVGWEFRYVTEAVYQVHFPQRIRQIHPGAVQMGQLLHQHVPVTALGQVGFTEMHVPVRVRYIDPVGGVHIQGDAAQFASKQGELHQPLGHHALQGVQGDRPLLIVTAVIQQYRTDMHGRAVAVLVNKGRVQSRKLLHGSSVLPACRSVTIDTIRPGRHAGRQGSLVTESLYALSAARVVGVPVS